MGGQISTLGGLACCVSLCELLQQKQQFELKRKECFQTNFTKPALLSYQKQAKTLQKKKFTEKYP